MTSVNDLMKYLNKLYGFSLPVLPLSEFTKELTKLWKCSIRGWIPGNKLPPVVKIDIKPKFFIPLAGGNIEIEKAYVNIKAKNDTIITCTTQNS